jgi:hypothetical protein
VNGRNPESCHPDARRREAGVQRTVERKREARHWTLGKGHDGLFKSITKRKKRGRDVVVVVVIDINNISTAL